MEEKPPSEVEEKPPPKKCKRSDSPMDMDSVVEDSVHRQIKNQTDDPMIGSDSELGKNVSEKTVAHAPPRAHSCEDLRVTSPRLPLEEGVVTFFAESRPSNSKKVSRSSTSPFQCHSRCPAVSKWKNPNLPAETSMDTSCSESLTSSNSNWAMDINDVD